jgi:hypothetical protein
MRVDRGRSFVVDKYAQRELRYIYYSLREGLHIESYYDGSSGFDELRMCLDDMNLHIRNIEGVESN